jgi:DNA polymerase III subunit delta
MPKAKVKRDLSKIYAVVGSDEAEVKRVARDMAGQLTPPTAGDFGLEIIDGCADNAEQAASRVRSAIEALQTLPFFGSAKVVWLKNANFLGDSPTGRSASVQGALEEFADVINSDLGSGITFLLSASDIDKRRSFYKALCKRAEVQVFDRLDSTRTGWEEEATEIVRRRAEARRLNFHGLALELFVLLTGGDTRQIENELEKIDIFLGGGRGFQSPSRTDSSSGEPFGKIDVSPTRAAGKMANGPTAETAAPQVTVDVVRALVPLSRAGVIFELGNALAERDLERALKLVRRLLDQGESAIGILLVAILPTIRNLMLAKDLMEHHRVPRPHVPFQFIAALNRLPTSATEHLPRKKDGGISGYALGIAAQNAHRFEPEQLIEGMDTCLDANVRLVTSQLDHELILTEIIVKLIGKEAT